MSTPIESLLEENQEPKKSYAEVLETVDKTQLQNKTGVQDYIPEINIKEQQVPKPFQQPTPIHSQTFQPAFHFQQPIQVPSVMKKPIASEQKKPKNSFEIIQNEIIYIAIICTLVYSPGFQTFLSYNFKTIYTETSLVTTIFNTFIIVILYVLLKKVKIKVN